MRRRMYQIGMILSLCFLVILGKLAYTQLYSGSVYASRSFQTQADLFTLEDHHRGDILDRNGKSLLNSCTAPALIIIPQADSQTEKLHTFLADYLPAASLTLLDQKRTSDEPLVIPLSQNEASALSRAALPYGMVVAPYHWRYQDPLAVHLIGCLDYSGHGVKGLEKYYDALLSSSSSAYTLAYLSDAYDHSLPGGEGVRIIPPDTEKNALYLTLDHDIQKTLEDCLNRHHIAKGAAIILDVSTNEVLASASRPLYDPQDLSQTFGFNDNQLERSLGAEYRYYPGSTFKIATAIAALESHCPALAESFSCTNEAPYAKCPRTHAEVDLKRGLKVSCNNYFIHLGESMGRETLERYLLDTLHFSLEPGKSFDSFSAIANGVIGQELFRVSPWQMAQLITIIANDGYGWQTDAPWQEQLTASIEINGQRQPVQIDRQFVPIISAETAHILQEDLAAAIDSPDGTHLTYAGKTGTPEITAEDGSQSYLAWYVGYAPAESPKYAVAVVIEDILGVPKTDLSGGKYALPFFQDLIQQLP